MESVLKGKNPVQKKESEYPYVGISPNSGRVVIFTSPEHGTLIHEPDHSHGLGYVCGSWAEFDFEPLRGDVVLSN